MYVAASDSSPLSLLMHFSQQRDFSIRDAALTKTGREQATLLHTKLAGNLEREVELVVTSPLRRTLQTTLGALGRPARRHRAARQGECRSLLPCSGGV